MSFTAEQIADFKAFRFVQRGGKYNIFDPKARQATGMTPERYEFTLKNYKALQTIADALSKGASK